MLLLDLKMPKVDGLDVLRTIKADPALRSIPVVMLTSSREEQDLIASYALGVNSYVVKPVDFGEFMEAVRHIGVFWAVMRLLVEEPDEFLRLLLVRQILIATGFCLTIMTVWEFLQNFDLVAPGTGGFGAAFFWFLGLGVGAIYNKLTLGTAGADCR